MPPKRERYNSKARQSVAGGSAHSHKGKKAKRAKLGHPDQGDGDAVANGQAAPADTNAQIITDEHRRAQKMMHDLVSQNQDESSKPMSSKKRKRFEAYVAKQLKKEDRVRLLSSLAETSTDVADRSKLVSASTLGSTRGGLTNEERAEKLQRKGEGKARRRRAAAFQVTEGDEDADLDGLSSSSDAELDADIENEQTRTNKRAVQAELESGPVGEVNEDAERRARIEAATRAFDSAPSAKSNGATMSKLAAHVGAALAVDADGKPVSLASMSMRKRKKKAKRSEKPELQERSTARSRLRASGTSWGKVAAKEDDDEHQEDNDFDSSASSGDESQEEQRAPPIPTVPRLPTDKGKGKVTQKSVSFDLAQTSKSSNGDGQSDDQGDGNHASSEEEMEEEVDRAILEAMRIRGLDPAQLGFGGAYDGNSDVEDASSGASSSEDEPGEGDEANGALTDDELEEERDTAILAELKRRGMDPRAFGFDLDENEDDEKQKPGDSLASMSASPESSAQAQSIFADRGISGDSAESPPWEGFPSEVEGPDQEYDVVSFDEVMDDDDERSEAEPASGESEGSEDEDEDEDGSSEDEGDGEPSDHTSRRRGLQKTSRSTGFKDWARGAMGLNGNASKGDTQHGETSAAGDDGFELQPVAGLKVRVGDIGPQDGIARGPLGQTELAPDQMSAFASKHYAELKARKGETGRPFVLNVPVQRSVTLQEARLKLPVVAEEEHIVKTIIENPIVVICGETGSGKTTQVPQFLYERGFGTPGSQNPGMIGITQPRRVAALSMTQRVASELSLPPNKVSHQIRYDVTVSPSTSIKFMTDGVLLRELATDFLLRKYSLIIIDEAHERSVNTDILIGLLTRIVRLREKRWLANSGEGSTKEAGTRPLRLVIMSATLRVSDFTDNASLFPPLSPRPPIVDIGARQHPVTLHFNRRTVHDYIAESVTKVSKIHARLPPGGILVFLTGQQEIVTVCKRLEQRYGRKAIEQRRAARSRAEAARLKGDEGQEDGGENQEQQSKFAAIAGFDPEAEEVDLGVNANEDLAADVDDGAAIQEDEDALDTDEEDEEGAHDDDLPPELRDDSDVPLHILPLYSMLPSEKQMRVFEEPPADSRLVVVATNVAETSLTIPNIRYVVDCGRAKERSFDAASGIQNFNVTWISKASASQRAGRAGRTGPGHCYRLYSSAVYEDHFEQFSKPEILRTPIDGLVLQMKAMNIIHVASFPFPTCPERDALVAAERTLIHLNALEQADSKSADGRKFPAARITQLGRVMTQFPLSPRFAKLLVQGQQHGCLPFVVALVAALSVGDPFLREEALQDHLEDDSEDGADCAVGDDNKQHLKSEREKQRQEGKSQRQLYFAAMSRFSALGASLSDVYRLLSAVGAYEYDGGSTAFCERNFLRPKAMEEIHKLRAQLANLVVMNLVGLSEGDRASIMDPKLKLPNEMQLKVLRQLITAAFVDQVAVRADLSSPTDAAGHAVHSYAKMKSTRYVPYRAMGVGREFAYIHPSSTLFHKAPPEWIVFTEVQRSKSRAVTIKNASGDGETVLQEGKLMLRGITKINPAWLSTLGRNLCTFDKPVDACGGNAAGAADLATLARARAAAKAGGSAGNTVQSITRDIMLVPRYAAGVDSGASAGLGWELPPVKAKQKLENGRWVTLM
ncbi:P-loop containing nucleoside triphosphate hydrolase protein [Tilletiaria anomala UBC 951]|uniref:RNA helicase n=1 Tax=Tilletiaria anomala (strain ATCC 24038 / CBS 436.72 / UBC 951) TaxID=1037660 RepID=A0A066WCF2_TILAU|nr:P-loop containing nucleoside triphosphate hydrolase protein [Tilletiaria anomala UBC 951]KDN51411.1 P-loop containing nucleoside triphosphate hydrolase protein [Tilletiaria anomala UBC 951]